MSGCSVIATFPLVLYLDFIHNKPISIWKFFVFLKIKRKLPQCLKGTGMHVEDVRRKYIVLY